MIRALAALVAALWLASCGEPARDWPEPSPALWEVSGAQGEKGWLFGTIHALPDGADWRTPLLDSVLAQTGVLVVEVFNLGDADVASQAFTAFAAGRGLPPLLSRVPAQDRPALTAALERADIDEAELAATESWAAAMLIANASRASEAGNGVDRALLSRGLPAIALESYPAQFSIFDRLAPEDQQVLLVETARSDAAKEQALVAAWIAGDTAAIERETLGGFLADPELREALLVKRNQAWAERIEPLLAEGRRPLVAVGTAHLLGPDGVAALLEARGYTVRRIQ